MARLNFIRLFAMVTISAFSALASFAQTLPGESYLLYIVPKSGTDTLVRTEQTAPGIYAEVTYTRDWVENVWYRNGTPIYQELGEPFAPLVPSGVSGSVSYASTGTFTVKYRWLDPSVEPPSAVGVRVSSSAIALYNAYNGSGSAHADNGFGDQEEYYYEGAQYEGKSAAGSHFRVLEVNDEGEADLDFNVAIECEQSQNSVLYAAVMGHLSSSVTLDDRSVNLLIDSQGLGGYSRAGNATQGSINHTVELVDMFNSPIIITKAFDIMTWESLNCPIITTALFGSYIAHPFGLKSTKSTEPFATPQIWLDVLGTSYWAYRPNNSNHGEYVFTIPNPENYVPLSGTLGALNYIEKVGPHNIVYGPWLEYEFPLFEDPIYPIFIDEDIGSVGTSQTLEYQVTWEDGVKGSFAHNLDYKRKGEIPFSSAVERFESVNTKPAPILLKGPTNTITPDGYVESVQTSITCWKDKTPEWIKAGSSPVIGQILGYGRDILGAVKHATIVAAALSGIEVVIDETVGSQSSEYSVGRDDADFDPFEVSGGSLQDYLANKEDYDWKPYAKCAVHVMINSVQKFDSHGYQGTIHAPVEKKEPTQHGKKIFKVRWVFGTI